MTYRHMNSLWDLVWTKTCFVVVVVVFPSHSLFPGDQIIIQANSVFINPSPLSLILPESKLPASYPNPNFEFSPTSETEATVLNPSLCWSVHWHFVRTQSIIFLSKFYSLLYKRDCFVSLMQRKDFLCFPNSFQRSPSSLCFNVLIWTWGRELAWAWALTIWAAHLLASGEDQRTKHVKVLATQSPARAAVTPQRALSWCCRYF